MPSFPRRHRRKRLWRASPPWSARKWVLARAFSPAVRRNGLGRSMPTPIPKPSRHLPKLHLYCLEREPDPDRVAALQEKATGTERFVVKGRVLYLHTPDGMGRSLFAPKIEPTLKVPMTARNWRTALALRRMVEAL